MKNIPKTQANVTVFGLDAYLCACARERERERERDKESSGRMEENVERGASKIGYGRSFRSF